MEHRAALVKLESLKAKLNSSVNSMSSTPSASRMSKFRGAAKANDAEPIPEHVSSPSRPTTPISEADIRQRIQKDEERLVACDDRMKEDNNLIRGWIRDFQMANGRPPTVKDNEEGVVSKHFAAVASVSLNSNLFMNCNSALI